MHHISPARISIVFATALMLAGCAKSEQAAKDSASAAAAAEMAAPAPAPAPPPALSLSAIAGKWQVKSVPVSGADTTPTKYVLTATADTTGWMIVFPSGLKVPLQVSVSGDSLIDKTGTFQSQRRKGVKVKTEGVMRIQNGKLVGTTVAHYMSAGADSVLHMRVEGTKNAVDCRHSASPLKETVPRISAKPMMGTGFGGASLSAQLTNHHLCRWARRHQARAREVDWVEHRAEPSDEVGAVVHFGDTQDGLPSHPQKCIRGFERSVHQHEHRRARDDGNAILRGQRRNLRERSANLGGALSLVLAEGNFRRKRNSRRGERAI